MNGPPRQHRPALLLAQLGDYASAQFGERAASAGLRPSEAAVVRFVGRSHGLNQRQLAARLGAPPSRLVAILDELERQGLLRRERDADDRRNYQLSLTPAGEKKLARLTELMREHEAQLFGDLGEEELDAFAETLARLARIHGLDDEIHRGVSRPSTPGSPPPTTK